MKLFGAQIGMIKKVAILALLVMAVGCGKGGKVPTIQELARKSNYVCLLEFDGVDYRVAKVLWSQEGNDDIREGDVWRTNYELWNPRTPPKHLLIFSDQMQRGVRGTRVIQSEAPIGAGGTLPSSRGYLRDIERICSERGANPTSVDR